MTRKRVLSLLLALVMVLSLCVPALAAEAAEPVTDSEDAPEVIAVEEPAPIALEKPEDETAQKAVEDLKAAVAEAEAIEANLKSGVYTYDTGANTSPETELTAFEKALNEAKDLLTKIEDTTTKVKDSEITPKTQALAPYIGEGAKAEKFTAKATQYDVETTLAGLATTPADPSTDDAKLEYQPEYLAKAADLIAQKEALTKKGKNGTHQAIADLVEAFAVLAKEETAAKAPDKDDADALTEAIADAQALIDSGKYGSTSVSALSSELSTANGYVDRNGPYGLKDTTTLKQVNQALKNIAEKVKGLAENVAGLKIGPVAMNSGYTQLTVTITDGKTAEQADDNKYVVTAVLAGGKAEATYSSLTSKGIGADAATTAAAHTFKYDDIKKSGDSETKFKIGDVVTITLSTVDSEGKETVVATLDYTVGDYNGPKLVEAKWDTTSTDQFVVTLDKAQADYDSARYTSARIVVTDASGKEVKEMTGVTTKSVNVTGIAAADLAVGEYTFELFVKEVPQGGAQATEVSRGTVTAKIGAVSEYKGTDHSEALAKAKDLAAKLTVLTDNPTGYNNLEAVIAAAGDYETLIAKKAAGKTTSYYQEILGRLMTKYAEPLVAAADKTPNTNANRTAVDTMSKDLVAALKNLEEPTDMTALEAAIADAKALSEDDYSEGWTELQDAVKAGEAIVKAGSGDAAGAAKAILDAIEALVVKEADKTALEKAIAAVPSDLDTGNYDPSAVAAVKEALVAAEAILEKENAAQSKIDAAASALLAAIGALKTVKDGWVQAANGDFYYYKNGQMVKNQWVMSTRGLWYHMSASGVMDTGLTYITDASWGNGWYYLQESNRSDNCIGMMLKGWQKIIDDNGYGAGSIGWFETRTNGHGGKCTYTDGWGDFKNYVKQ